MPRTNAHDLYKGMLRPDAPEFAAKVRAVAGVEDRGFVDPKDARLGPTIPGWYGLYTRPDESYTPEQNKEWLGQQQRDLGINFPLEMDKVYGFGENANAQVWGHEFRHKAGINDEYTNRLLDAAMAGSEKQWNFAVDGYHDFMARNEMDRGADGAPMSREQVVYSLIKALSTAFEGDSGPWVIWAKKYLENKDGMLSPDRPKPIQKKPIRSRKTS